MIKAKELGIVGYGTIGQYICEALEKEEALNVHYICSRSITEESQNHNGYCTNKLESAHLNDLDLVVETANADVAKEYAEIILKKTNFMIFSTTVFANPEFYKNVVNICKEYNTTVFIPHGAILGLDGIYDGRNILESIHITTIKQPKGFGRNDMRRTVIYDGNTRGACNAYPKNVNVHAGLALAGIGFDKTQSTIISDPDIKGNTHIIEAKGNGTMFSITIESKPKGLVTGSYTPESGVGSIKRAMLLGEGLSIV